MSEDASLPHEELIDRWQAVSTPPPSAFARARTALGRAASAVFGLEAALRGPDAERAGVEWEVEHGLFATELFAARRPFRIALRPADLTLMVLDLDGAAIKTLPLEGATVGEAVRWLTSEAADLGTSPAAAIAPEANADKPLAVESPHALAELGRWYANADALLCWVARRTEGASPVRCREADLVIETHVALASREGEQARSVTVGMSPGDAAHAEPYFFVKPTPVAPTAQLPELLPPGRWEREPTPMAVLDASSVAEERDGDAQVARVRAFLESAVAAAHAAIHRDWRRR